MEIGFETIGNATLVCHDRSPVLVTDPWLTGGAYFGSWELSHAIPEETMAAIKHCPCLQRFKTEPLYRRKSEPPWVGSFLGPFLRL